MIVTKEMKSLRKNQEKITLHSVCARPGQYENMDLLFEMIPRMEELDDIFSQVSHKDNYDEWLAEYLDYIRMLDPWFFVIQVNDAPEGVIWVSDWERKKGQFYSCVLGGFAKRKVNPSWTNEGIHQVLKDIFQQTPVYIVRSETEIDNRAAKLAMFRAGFSHPEPRRALRMKGGQEINGIIVSITRPEFEEVLNEQR